jgi:ABC-type glutathione transport system ATPase component
VRIRGTKSRTPADLNREASSFLGAKRARPAPRLESDQRARIANFEFGAKAQHRCDLVTVIALAPAISIFLNPRTAPDASHFKNRTTQQMTTTSLISNQQTQTPARNGSTPLIRLTDVRKIFFTDEVETHAVSGVHLDIRDGEYVSIAGPSGCGKTTLLSILGLLDTPSAGSYALKGTEVANLSFADRARIRNRQIGFIFQSFNLIGDLTVYENVAAADIPRIERGRA